MGCARWTNGGPCVKEESPAAWLSSPTGVEETTKISFSSWPFNISLQSEEHSHDFWNSPDALLRTGRGRKRLLGV